MRFYSFSCKKCHVKKNYFFQIQLFKGIKKIDFNYSKKDFKNLKNIKLFEKIWKKIFLNGAICWKKIVKKSLF